MWNFYWRWVRCWSRDLWLLFKLFYLFLHLTYTKLIIDTKFVRRHDLAFVKSLKTSYIFVILLEQYSLNLWLQIEEWTWDIDTSSLKSPPTDQDFIDIILIYIYLFNSPYVHEKIFELWFVILSLTLSGIFEQKTRLLWYYYTSTSSIGQIVLENIHWNCGSKLKKKLERVAHRA